MFHVQSVMKKRSLLFLAMALMFQMGFTQNWQAQPKDTRISFKIKNFGLWVEGSLTGIQAQIQFDPSSPASGKMEGKVPVSSISTGIKKRDEHLQKEDYFHAQAYPFIIMRSEKLEGQGGEFRFTGQIDIRGVRQPIQFPFFFVEKDGRGLFTANFSLNRLAFQVGPSQGPLGTQVDVSLSVQVKALSEQE